MKPWDIVDEQQSGGNPWAVVDEKPTGRADLFSMNSLRELPRQAGLAGRYAMEGPAQALDLLAEPIRNFVVNPIVRAFGGTEITSQGQAASRLANSIGLPEPQDATERVVGDASRLLAGSGGIMGAAGKAATIPGGVGTFMESLAQAPGMQASGAIGAGLAGGGAREAGAGPYEQFAASLAGGLAAPLAVNAARAPVAAATSRVKGLFAPKTMETALKVELERAGIDWAAMSKAAQQQLMADAKKAMYSGQELDPAALKRLADFRNIGATPTVGGITMNPRTVTLERNLAKQQANVSRPFGGPDLPGMENQNTGTVIRALEDVAQSPMDTYATGKGLIGEVMSQDAARTANVNGLYNQARDSAGRSLPLDRQSFVNEAFDLLAKENKAAFLPPQVETILNQISTNQMKVGGKTLPVPFTVDVIDNLKTMLASASRSAGDGNTKRAISLVRQALENAQPVVSKSATGSQLPITGAMGARLQAADSAAQTMAPEALAAFDKARAAARSQFEWQKSASFIEDTIGGASPDKFVQKHIISGEVDDLARMAKTIGETGQLRDAVRKQLIEYITTRGRVDRDVTKFSSAGMNDALKALGDRKLALFFSPDEIQRIRSAVNVARYIQAQPAGSAVNNSNTAAMVFGKIWDVLLSGGEALPLVKPWVADPLRAVTLNMQSRQMGNIPRGLLAPQPPPPRFPATPLLFAAGGPYSDQ